MSFGFFDLYTVEILLGSSAGISLCMALFLYFRLTSSSRTAPFLPAAVLKTYVDSVLTNALAVKSRFLGSADFLLDPNAHMQAASSASAGVGGGGIDPSLLVMKETEIATLKAQIQSLKSIASAAPAAGGGASADPKLVEENSKFAAKIQELTAQLAAAQATASKAGADAGGGGGGNSPELLEKIKQLENRLKEYEIIEDDLANLKKLQQENAELKKSLAGGAGASPAAAAAPAPTPPPAAAIVEEPKPPVAAAVVAPEPVVAAPPAPADPVVDVKKADAEANQAAGLEALEKVAQTAAEAPAQPEPTVSAVATPEDAGAPPAAKELSQQDMDLLMEFEKMVASSSKS